MTAKIKSDLKSIAEHLPNDATYSDVMYELYVRMKVSKGKQAVKEGRVTSHSDVKKRFIK